MTDAFISPYLRLPLRKLSEVEGDGMSQQFDGVKCRWCDRVSDTRQSLISECKEPDMCPMGHEK